MTPTFFFDSHGQVWATCRGSHPAAVAFGPAGCARPATDAEAGIPAGDGTPRTRATAAGLVEDDEVWTPGFVQQPGGHGPQAGEPCPRCGATLLAFSPSGRGDAACDECCLVWGE